MWWSKAVITRWTGTAPALAFVTAFALSACDFTPVYAPDATGARLTGAVAIAPTDDELEFVLVRELENSLGPSQAPRYLLSTGLSTRSERVSITADQDTNRFNLVGRATWTLTEDATGATIASGRADAFSSYSATGTTVATLSAERDAYRRLMVILADKITLDITTRELDMGPSEQ